MNATFFIILLCFLSYGFMMVAVMSGVSGEYLLNELGFSGDNAFARPWTFITTAFIHADIGHLLSNMFAMLFFGTSLENEIGKKRMLMIFFGGVIAGDLISMLFYASDTILIGASAGIFALLGAGMIIKPFDMSFYPFTVPVPLELIGVIYIIYNSLGFVSGDPSISYIAHAGGVIVGLAYGFHKEGFKKSMTTIIALTLAVLLIPVIISILLGMLA